MYFMLHKPCMSDNVYLEILGHLVSLFLLFVHLDLEDQVVPTRQAYMEPHTVSTN